MIREKKKRAVLLSSRNLREAKLIHEYTILKHKEKTGHYKKLCKLTRKCLKL